jgi:hypothetical protein
MGVLFVSNNQPPDTSWMRKKQNASGSGMFLRIVTAHFPETGSIRACLSVHAFQE